MQTIGTNDDNKKSTQPEKYSYEWWRAKAIIGAGFAWKNASTFLSLCALVISLKACDNTKRSATAAEKSAYAAERSVGVAEQVYKTTIKNFQLDQRAWVGIVQHGGPPEMVANVPYTWKFAVMNSGKTPALNVRNLIGYGEGRKGQKFVPPYPPRGPEENFATVIASGNRQFLQAGPVTVPQKAIDALKGGTDLFYVYGQIQYNDVFGATHCTIFCFALGPELPHMTSCAKADEISDTKCENID